MGWNRQAQQEINDGIEGVQGNQSSKRQNSKQGCGLHRGISTENGLDCPNITILIHQTSRGRSLIM